MTDVVNAPPPVPPPPWILISTVVPLTLNVLPAPIKFKAVNTPTATLTPPDCIPIPWIPLLAVITPIESTLVTSS